MGVVFHRGQQLGRKDLNIFLTNAADNPINVYKISYAIYDFTTGAEVLVGPPERNPQNPEVGEYYASVLIPPDANVGSFRIRWTIQEAVGKAVNSIVQEFNIQGQDQPALILAGVTPAQSDLVRRLRILLRDSWPDRTAKFRPPTHEDTLNGFNRVFGYLWEDYELVEFIDRSLDMVIAAPPRTPFMNVDALVQQRPEWRTLLLTGAMGFACFAMMLHWTSEQFNYSIGGVSLDLDKASGYQSAKENAEQRFNDQLEKAKQTVKIVKGLQQSRYGMGVRSSFGPMGGRGVLTPAKYRSF